MADLHETHSEIARMKGLARQHLYWSSINSDTEELVKRCRDFAENQRNPAEAKLHFWQPVKKSFERVCRTITE